MGVDGASMGAANACLRDVATSRMSSSSLLYPLLIRTIALGSWVDLASGKGCVCATSSVHSGRGAQDS